MAMYLAIPTLLLTGCSEPKPPKPIRPVLTTKVGDVSAISTRPFNGRATAEELANLSFRVGGPLIELLVDVGDEVSAGDIIARIDPNDFEVALRAAESEVSSVSAAHQAARSDYERVIRVQQEDPGATSQRVVDSARSLRDQTGAQISAFRSVVQAARDRLHYATLEAPFSGTIVDTYVENFENVLPKQPVVRLVNLARIEFEISVPETLISYHPYVETIDVEFDAIPDRSFPATISEIGLEADQSTRTFPVTLIVDQPTDVDILPGMAGQANITARLPEDAGRSGLEISTSAVFSDDPGMNSFVWIVDEASNTVSRRQVEVARNGEFGLIIGSGLEPGERIAVAGVHFLSDGQEIRILEADTAVSQP
jgi:RND family efflux transporter MFP subunit